MLGGYDNLVKIKEVIDKHGGNIWLHVDGAWGGNVIFSPNLRHYVEGLEFADSFNINAHKGLGLPN